MNDVEYLKKYYQGDIEEAIKRLNNGEPVQYIVGNVEFYGNIIEVDKNVLIPRFETEQLVEKTIKYIEKIFDKDIDIVDLGTGSGCIAITLKNEINCNIDAVDISIEAIQIAKKNAEKNNCDINFILGDMLKPLTKKYDVIISNPPYIAKDEEIMEIVKNNEPYIALFADNEGLKYYYQIIDSCESYLKEKFLIAFEIGQNQASDIRKYCMKKMDNIEFIIEKDLQGLDRFVFIIKN